MKQHKTVNEERRKAARKRSPEQEKGYLQNDDQGKLQSTKAQ